MGLLSKQLPNKADRVEGGGSRRLCSPQKALQKSMGGGGIQRVNPMRSKLLDKTRPYVFFCYTILCKHFLRDLQIFAASVAARLLVCWTPLHRNVSAAGSREKRGLINRAPPPPPRRSARPFDYILLCFLITLNYRTRAAAVPWSHWERGLAVVHLSAHVSVPALLCWR